MLYRHLACEEDRISDARLLVDAGAHVSVLNNVRLL